jgi:hypothetical protein
MIKEQRTPAHWPIQYTTLSTDGTVRYHIPHIGDTVRIIQRMQISGFLGYELPYQEQERRHGGQIGTIEGFVESPPGWPKIIVRFPELGWATFDYFMVQYLENVP